MTNDEIIAEFNEADGPEFSEAATLAALMELSNEIVALSLYLGVELPEDLLESLDAEDCNNTEYADGLSGIVQYVRNQIGEIADGHD